jgi:hypothetical protein
MKGDTVTWLSHDIDPDTPAGLCKALGLGAEICLTGAKKLDASSPGFDLPDRQILAFHALELALKAFLAKHGLDPRDPSKQAIWARLRPPLQRRSPPRALAVSEQQGIDRGDQRVSPRTSSATSLPRPDHCQHAQRFSRSSRRSWPRASKKGGTLRRSTKPRPNSATTGRRPRGRLIGGAGVREPLPSDKRATA